MTPKMPFTEKEAQETIASAVDKIQTITGVTAHTTIMRGEAFAHAWCKIETLHGAANLDVRVADDHASYSLHFQEGRNPFPPAGGLGERWHKVLLLPDSMTRGLTGLSKVKRADLRARTLPTLLTMLCADLATVMGYQRAA